MILVGVCIFIFIHFSIFCGDARQNKLISGTSVRTSGEDSSETYTDDQSPKLFLVVSFSAEHEI